MTSLSKKSKNPSPLQRLARIRNWNKFQLGTIEVHTRHILNRGSITQTEKAHLIVIDSKIAILKRGWEENYVKIKREIQKAQEESSKRLPKETLKES